MPVLRARARRRASRGRGSARPSPATRARSCGTVEETIERVEVGRGRRRAARAGCAARRRARRRSTADGREAPVLDELVAAEGPEVGLGVADVDDEQHWRRGSIGSGHAPTKLYVVHGSHPCAAVERALRAEGASPTERVELLPPAHVAVQRVRFGGAHRPGAAPRGRARRSSARARSCAALDELAPEPPLLPRRRRPRERRARGRGLGRRGLAAASRRRLLWRGVPAPPARDGQLPGGARAAAVPAPVLLRARARGHPRSSGAERRQRRRACARTCAALPGHLDRIDGWIADGLLGGEQPERRRPADRRARSRLLLTHRRRRARLSTGRPAERHARAHCGPDWAGRGARRAPTRSAGATTPPPRRRPAAGAEVAVTSRRELVGRVLGDERPRAGDLGEPRAPGIAAASALRERRA